MIILQTLNKSYNINILYGIHITPNFDRIILTKVFYPKEKRKKKKVELSKNWPINASTQVPIKTTLQNTSQLPIFPIKDIPINITLANVHHYHVDTNDILLKIFPNKVSVTWIDKIIKAFKEKQIDWKPRVQTYFTQTGRPPDSDIAEYQWLDDWTINYNKEFCTIKTATPKEIKYYWLNQRINETTLTKIPYNHHPSIRIHEKHWKKFWSSDIKSKTKEIWWRIIMDRIPYRKRLHSWNMIRYNTNVCQICNQQQEDQYHFMVSCPNKLSFWLQASTMTDINITADWTTIWRHINMVEIPNSKCKENGGRIYNNCIYHRNNMAIPLVA
ncbi:unnamed protein product [Cunninghamella echinulata]